MVEVTAVAGALERTSISFPPIGCKKTTYGQSDCCGWCSGKDQYQLSTNMMQKDNLWFFDPLILLIFLILLRATFLSMYSGPIWKWFLPSSPCFSCFLFAYKCFNPYDAGGLFGQYKMMQNTWRMMETLAHGYSSESIQRELSNDYQHDMV